MIVYQLSNWNNEQILAVFFLFTENFVCFLCWKSHNWYWFSRFFGLLIANPLNDFDCQCHWNELRSLSNTWNNTNKSHIDIPQLREVDYLLVLMVMGIQRRLLLHHLIHRRQQGDRYYLKPTNSMDFAYEALFHFQFRVLSLLLTMLHPKSRTSYQRKLERKSTMNK